MLGLLTRTLGETHHPEAARETCRREQDRGDEDPLSPTRATERDRNQEKSDEPEGHRHFGEIEDRGVDELEFEQRLPRKRLEDGNRPCSERNGCGGELDERDGPGWVLLSTTKPVSLLSDKVLSAGTRLRGNSSRKIEIPTGW